MFGRKKSKDNVGGGEEDPEGSAAVVVENSPTSNNSGIDHSRSLVYGDSPQSTDDNHIMAEQHPEGRRSQPSQNNNNMQQQQQQQQQPHANTATYLMGGSGVSLDGRSLVVPMDRDYDEVSSINTALYTYGQEMRIVGSLADDQEHNGGVSGVDIEGAHHHNHGASPRSGGANNAEMYAPQGSYEYHNARPSKKDAKTLNSSSDSYEGGCLPLWITDAPRWLKIVIILSTALLVGAIVLIGVGASLAVQKNSDNADSSSSTLTQTSPGGFPASPSAPPMAAPMNPSPTTNAGVVDEEGDDEGGNDDETTAPPVPAPTRPTITTTAPVTTAPAPATSPPSAAAAATAAPTSSTVTFFATGGRFTGDALAALPEQLATLPLGVGGNAVMFHLGDWNSPFATSCSEESYQTNVDLFSHSAVPVYFVPADNEYNDCPDPEQAFQFWEQYLLGYETQFWPASDQWNTTRQEPDYAENFAYVFNGVLFVGINLVGGVVHDQQEWQERHAADLRWIDEQYYLHEGDFEVLVILAHSDPDIQANANFFETFYERVQFNYNNHQVLFVHRNLGVESWALEPQFNGIENLMVVVVEGSIWPPMQIQLNVQAGTVDIDQGQWYTDYMAASSTATSTTGNNNNNNT